MYSRPFGIIIPMFVFLSIWMWNGIFMFCFQNTKKKVLEEMYSQTYWRLLQFAFFTYNLRLSNWDSMNLRQNVLKIVFLCISRRIFLRLEILLYQYSAADKYEVWAERSTRTYIFYIRFSLYVPRVDKYEFWVRSEKVYMFNILYTWIFSNHRLGRFGWQIWGLSSDRETQAFRHVLASRSIALHRLLENLAFSSFLVLRSFWWLLGKHDWLHAIHWIILEI